MGKGYDIHVSITKYPGEDYHYAICDVCGFKFRKNELTLVKDKFNLQNRLLVCKADLDVAQPQLRPFKAREYKAPRITRPEQSSPTIANPNDDTLPSAPVLLQAVMDPLTNVIDLIWQGPESGGSSAITGYAVYQSYPQLASPGLIATTSNGTPFYQDTVSDITQQYSYQVAAINGFGQGPLSNIAYWPFQNVNLSVQYIIMDTAPYSTITTDAGLAITMDGYS